MGSIIPGAQAEESSFWEQIAALLRQLGPIAAAHGLVIAVEPINRQESNIVNLSAEGLRMAAEVNHPNVQLLIDVFHLMKEGEDPDIILRAGPAIRHVHVADLDGRRFPRTLGSAVSGFFDRLQRIGYAGRCSIEAFTEDFAADARQALQTLRRQTNDPPIPQPGS